MATSSIYEDLIITDPKKIKEILDALNGPRKNILNLKPMDPPELPSDAEEIWFKRCKK